jgi:hypothetical protein
MIVSEGYGPGRVVEGVAHAFDGVALEAEPSIVVGVDGDGDVGVDE